MSKRTGRAVLLIIVMLMLAMLTGCNLHGYGVMEAGKINIVCTTFPLYDWTKNLVGEDNANVNVTLLIANGADAHSYQATARDIAMLSSCDVLVYVGGESDRWVEEAIVATSNPNRKIVRLMDFLGERVLFEEMVEGMQHEHDELCGHDGDDEHENHVEHADEDEEYDEHVWLSVRNARILCKALMEMLCEEDPDSQEMYHMQYDAYDEELVALDEQLKTIVTETKSNTLVFGDRFPFRYLMEDYGLSYYAAFPGCSAETEASFETIMFLAGKLDELHSRAIVVLENSNPQIANTVVQNTRDKNQEIVVLDSMQAVTKNRIEAGEDYVSIMKHNIMAIEHILAN